MAAGPGHHDTVRLWLIRTDLPEDMLSRLAALLELVLAGDGVSSSSP
jgi:hypothetical protein